MSILGDKNVTGLSTFEPLMIILVKSVIVSGENKAR
jgi:hypothetical protein